MSEIRILKDQIIYSKSAKQNNIGIILDGTVEISMPGGNITLSPGNIIGLLDLKNFIHGFDYRAVTDVIIDFIPVKDIYAFYDQLLDSPSLCYGAVNALIRSLFDLTEQYKLQLGQCNDLYTTLIEYEKEYHKLCKLYDYPITQLPEMDHLIPFAAGINPEDDILPYYNDLQSLLKDSDCVLYQKSGFIKGFVQHILSDSEKILKGYQETEDYEAQLSPLVLNDSSLDFLQLFEQLHAYVIDQREDTVPVAFITGKLLFFAKSYRFIDNTLYKNRQKQYKSHIQQLENAAMDNRNLQKEVYQSILEKLKGSAKTILDFANMDQDFQTEFTTKLSEYQNMDGSVSVSDKKELSKWFVNAFATIYEACFFESLKCEVLPAPVSMFLYFGYIDEKLCHIKNAISVFEMTAVLDKRAQSNQYYFYEYLLKIYQGQRLPHIDTFDRDYGSALKVMKKDGAITEARYEEMLDDPKEMVHFEIQNILTSAMPITNGKNGIFFPFLSQQNLVKKPDDCIVSKSKMKSVFSDIVKIDFSAFYREYLFSDPSIGIKQEFLQKEVIPDMIMLPCVGIRGILWQEMEGYDKSSPGTMFLPAFCLSDLNLVALRLTGEFRWEMCKKLQGSRWGDITYPSLTSYYTDYLQFYKKNQDLSSDAKEKCQNQLIKVGNRYKEVFVLDYVSWILYESKGNARLNKVARKILSTYCPFAREIRDEVYKNPLFSQNIDRYETHKKKELTRINSVIFKINRNKKNNVPEELTDYALFLER